MKIRKLQKGTKDLSQNFDFVTSPAFVVLEPEPAGLALSGGARSAMASVKPTFAQMVTDQSIEAPATARTHVTGFSSSGVFKQKILFLDALLMRFDEL